MRLTFCVACSERRKTFQHHHLVTKAEGGTDDPTNLVTLCWSCQHEAARASEGKGEALRVVRKS